MRMTAEIIQRALTYTNPVGERELNLRGRQFTHIENMGAALADIESVDLTDNQIQLLGNFPHRPRLTTLLMAGNRISQLQPGLARSIPALASLSLTDNNIQELADLDALGGLTGLVHLNMTNNPVTTKENYRLYAIFRIPSVRFLDSKHVRGSERDKAHELFGTPADPTELAQAIMRQRPAVVPLAAAPGATGNLSARIKLTERERAETLELIRNAKTLEDIARLEMQLQEGKIPTR